MFNSYAQPTSASLFWFYYSIADFHREDTLQPKLGTKYFLIVFKYLLQMYLNTKYFQQIYLNTFNNCIEILNTTNVFQY